MKTKTLLLLAPALLGCATLFAQAKPNVLFIMTDQQSHRMMSCAGNQWLRTPHMDAIASRGYRFD